VGKTKAAGKVEVTNNLLMLQFGLMFLPAGMIGGGCASM